MVNNYYNTLCKAINTVCTFCWVSASTAGRTYLCFYKWIPLLFFCIKKNSICAKRSLQNCSENQLQLYVAIQLCTGLRSLYKCINIIVHMCEGHNVNGHLNTPNLCWLKKCINILHKFGWWDLYFSWQNLWNWNKRDYGYHNESHW